MNRILKSSNFWNAVIASIFMVITVFITADGEAQKNLIMYQFILFGGRTAVSGFSDIIKSSKKVTFNPETGKDEKI